jgi:hypothetical protein
VITDEMRVSLAKDYVRQNFETGEPWSMTIARAIMEERERCASWHDHCASSFAELGDEKYATWHKANAAAIRGTSST